MRRIHIVGSSPRTGTTLLTELLTCCFQPEGFCEHELSIFSEPGGPARTVILPNGQEQSG